MKIIEMSTGEVWENVSDVLTTYPKLDAQEVLDNCEHKQKTCGYCPITKAPLNFKYYERIIGGDTD